MAHSYTNLLFHVVCGTKRRLPWMTPEIRERMDKYVGGILRAEQCSLLAAGGMPDHAHWFVRLHPTRALADVMRDVKSRSSGWVRDQFQECREFAWQNGYGGFSVSQSGAEAVTAHIARQEEHHRAMNFEVEYEGMLRLNGIDFDPAYLWKDADAD